MTLKNKELRETKSIHVIRFRGVVLTLVVRIQFGTLVNWKIEPELVTLLVPTIRLTVVVELCLTV